MTTRCEPFGAGKIYSEDFGEWYNPSPGWPFLHHNKMLYDVEAVPADGYELSHWQAVGRQSNNPNDIFDVVYESSGVQFPDLTVQRNNGIKSPLIYLVAHFKKIDPVLESPPTTVEPETTENDGCCIPTITDPDNPGAVTKQQALDALETVRRFVKGI